MANNFYQTEISKILERQKRTDIDPRHVEGFMRLEHSTLDRLSPKQFLKEIEISINMIDFGGKDMAEKIAKSFGL